MANDMTTPKSAAALAEERIRTRLKNARSMAEDVTYITVNVADLEAILATDAATQRPGEDVVAIEAEMLRQLRHYTDCYLSKWPNCGAPTEAEVDSAIVATPPSASASQPVDSDDLISIPRSLIGAACSAIEHGRKSATLLDQLRHYTVGNEFSTPPNYPESDLARDFPPAGGLTECDMGDSYE